MYNGIKNTAISAGLPANEELILPLEIEAPQVANQILSIFEDVQVSNYAKCQIISSVLRVAAFCASSFSGVPFIPIARAAVSNEVLGYVLATNVVFSFALGSSWGWQNIIKNFNPDEKSNLSNNYSIKRRFIIASMSILSGAATSIPSTYFAYIYNENRRFWVIFNYFDSLGLHSFGFNELYNKVTDNIISGISNKEIFDKEELTLLRDVRKELTILIRKASTAIVIRPDKYLAWSNMLNHLHSSQNLNSNQKLMVLFKEMTNLHPDVQILPSALYKRGIPRNLTRLIGDLLIPTPSMFVNCILAYGASSLITPNTTARMLFTAITTLAGALIDYYANDATYARLFDNVYDLMTNGYIPTSAELFYQKSFRVTAMLLVLSGVGTALTALPSLKNALGEQLESTQPLILTVVMLSLIGQCISKLYMSFDLVKDLFNFYTKNYGTHEAKELLNLSLKLEKLAIVISELNLIDFKHLVDICFNDVIVRQQIENQTVYQGIKNYSISISSNRHSLFNTRDNSRNQPEKTDKKSFFCNQKNYSCGII